MTDRKLQSTLSHWSIPMAIFGGVCNLLSVVFNIYQSYYLQHLDDVWSSGLILAVAFSLAPLLVLFALRRLSLIVLAYASILFLILVWRVNYLLQYSGPNPPFHKFDEPGLLLFLLGVISAVVVLVWAIIRSLTSDNASASR